MRNPFKLPDEAGHWRPVLRSATDVAAYAGALSDSFDPSFATAEHRVRLEICGAVFEIASDLSQQLALASYALAGTQTTAEPTSRLLISGAGALPGLPPVPLWENHTYNDARMCRKFEPTDLRLYHYRERDFWQFFDKSSGRGAQLMATPISVPDWDTGSPLRNLVRWHLTHETQGFVHAGTLGEEGHGLMFAGRGGSGKSGTVLAGLLAGMDSVGDDYVLARLTPEGGVSAHSIFKTLKNDPKGLQRLGVDTTETGRFAGLGFINWQGKHQFTFHELVERDPVAALQIRALCVPKVAEADRTTIKPMPRSAAFMALSQTGFEQMPGDSRISLNLCSELIKRLPVFEISLGTEPAEIIDTLRGFLRAQIEDQT